MAARSLLRGHPGGLRGLEVGRVVGRLCNSPGKLSLGHVLRWWLCKVMAGLGRGEFEGQ